MTVQKGDKTEVLVQAELMSRGYQVCIPSGDVSPYDLVLDRDGSLERVQVKTGWLGPDEDVVIFKVSSTNTKTDGRKTITYDGKIDSFVVYCYDISEFYYVPIDEVESSSKMKLRLHGDYEYERPNINWASEYRLSNRIGEPKDL